MNNNQHFAREAGEMLVIIVDNFVSGFVLYLTHPNPAETTFARRPSTLNTHVVAN